MLATPCSVAAGGICAAWRIRSSGRPRANAPISSTCLHITKVHGNSPALLCKQARGRSACSGARHMGTSAAHAPCALTRSVDTAPVDKRVPDYHVGIKHQHPLLLGRCLWQREAADGRETGRVEASQEAWEVCLPASDGGVAAQAKPGTHLIQPVHDGPGLVVGLVSVVVVRVECEAVGDKEGGARRGRQLAPAVPPRTEAGNLLPPVFYRRCSAAHLGATWVGTMSKFS